jgi:hypothetical protein
MKLACSLTHPRGKSLDMVLPSYVSLCLAQQAWRNIAKMDNCLMVLVYVDLRSGVEQFG